MQKKCKGLTTPKCKFNNIVNSNTETSLKDGQLHHRNKFMALTTPTKQTNNLSRNKFKTLTTPTWKHVKETTPTQKSFKEIDNFNTKINL